VNVILENSVKNISVLTSSSVSRLIVARNHHILLLFLFLAADKKLVKETEENIEEL